MGCKFLCCYFGDSDKRAPIPNRPVEDGKTREQKRDPSAETTQHNAVDQQEQDGKSNVLGPSGTETSGADMKCTLHDTPGLALTEYKGQEESSVSTENPPPYHNWQDAVPDTAIFPPPPTHAYLYSNTGNASAEDADRAHEFCDNTPLWNPVKPSDLVYSCVQSGDLRPVKPQEYDGDLDIVDIGKWRGRTRKRNGDCILLTGLPVYFPTEDSPLVTQRSKTIYFEVKLIGTYGGTHDQVPGFSIGYAAQPYPTWRSPGWERGSLSVFSDDGCRFVNDSWGGREFTTEFKQGETVGLGMTFSLPKNPAGAGSGPLEVEIFLTRDGRPAGSWDLHEPADTESGGVKGLEGDFDLYGAVGLFGGVEFEVCFDRSEWLWPGHS